VNIRSLTRGDGVVIGAAVVLFIASFLSFYDYGSIPGGGSLDAPNAWDGLGYGLGLYMAGIAGGALVVVNHALPQPRKVLGLELDQVGAAFAIVTAWSLFWTMVDSDGAGSGLILGFLAALVLAAAAVAGRMIPALTAPLLSAPRPAAGPQPYAGQQPAGYGYPGGQQQPSYGGQQQPYGGQPPASAQSAQGGQQPSQGQQQPPAPGFSPFWFAVPAPRPLYAEDGSSKQVAELAPGTWFLAVDQRGTALIAQTQDGRRGLLQDTSGIQRG
jgi:hypothetical protein